MRFLHRRSGYRLCLPMADPPFSCHPAQAGSPVVIAVPHAGRDYPADVLARARVPRAVLEGLEDRFADLAIWPAVDDGAAAIVSRVARAMIDLNRDEREIEPGAIEGPSDLPTITTPRTRSGLGLIPRRLARDGDLWARKPDAAEVHRRIEEVHRLYHCAIEEAMTQAIREHGAAVLIDWHSMPPLAGPAGPRIVFGTLGRRSCSAAMLGRAIAVARAAGLDHAVDQPYAGGYTLDRHGRPALGRHAIQVEVDRSLYLAADLRTPVPSGVARIADFLRSLAAALAEEAAPGPLRVAAE